MENTIIWLLLSVLIPITMPAYGCTIEGLEWSVAASESILDTFRGNIWNRSTSDIEGIQSIQYSEGLNNGPYVAILHTDSRLLISTNDSFEKYEEYETAMSMGFTIAFRCTGGSTNSFVFEIRVNDTNNNDPQFRPSNTYEFTIVPPTPPGFRITNCVDDIIVRDIDLTTQRIDFEISGSSLFQIAYDNSSTIPKEFKAALRTTTLIRSVPEPIILTVKATDVDTTGDPRRTATAIVKIIADTEFTFPDEPIFSQPFYLATYTMENELILQDSITLRQGFDEEVVFSFEGQYSHFFELVTIGNEVSFKIKEPVSVELYTEGQIFLVVKAERNYTSGATSTVVVQLPEAIYLAFEAGLYEGSIEDNELNLGALQLKQGYEDTAITVNITSEYKSYFIAYVNGSIITLSMNPLSDSIIQENNFINLQVIATTTLNSTATTIVTLEIIKDDFTTPVFERNLYTGSYDSKTGLSLEQIIIIQGYDNTVTVNLEGEHSTLFDKMQDGPNISLSLSSLPSELITERDILVSVRATKPRTVGANAVVRITQPKARDLSFENFLYKGNFEENIIALETIVLNVGYDSDVSFNLKGDRADYFNINVEKNEITLGVKEQLPEDVLENSFLLFVLSASGTRTVTATTTILLEIIRQETVAPVFSKYMYGGTYINSTYIDFETISLMQGYDDTVTFYLDGENAQYFSIISDESRVMLTLESTIPEDLILNEKVFLFNLKAEKPMTLGANAAISLRFPQDLTEPAILRFSQNTYSGILNDGKLTVDNIVLESGYTAETNFVLSGDSAENFSISNSNNAISIKLSDTASLEDLKNNKYYLVLEIEATRGRAVPVMSTLIVDIPDTSVIMPVFEKAFYTGTYKKDSGLEFTEAIVLQIGFDKTVTFKLDGDNAQWFSVIQDGNSVSVISNVENPLPDEEFLENHHMIFTIIAQKPGSVSGQAAISIKLMKGSDIDYNISFDKVLYKGNIKGSVITHEPIRLSGFKGSNIDIIGELATSFKANSVNGDVTVDVGYAAVFPENLTYIALTLQAGSATAVLILDVTPSDAGLPMVSFGLPSYFLWADLNQTGMVGRVKATVDNGESVLYSITVNDVDLLNRVSINAEGEILLSTSVDTGIYNFKVTATAKTSQVSATAQVILRVDALPECSTEDGLPPLIILKRVEEEPHLNLVVLNQTQNKDCWYTITNIWPEDQSWLHVDNEALHARAIDREHKSIAFMISSQIQVELILHCDNDYKSAIVKRSLATGAGLEKDPYNYGSNKWILGDTITYNARRSIVNLIVEDINDNSPIFVGKENEPIYVGYPIPELENIILPRALIELKATDADIGENAALNYWSLEENLAIAATTGYVHVRNNAILVNNSRLTVYATDQNGKGLNGSLDIVIKLLDRNQIAVITVQNAFLDDENSILSNLSKLVGYDVKILRTAVISDNNEESEKTSRKKRETANTSGASLQLFVYGMSGSQLVNIDKLTSDLGKVVAADTVRVISLEDHLEGLEICSVLGQYTALFAATITLAVILFIFILIAAATVWFLLKLRKKQNYEKFSETNSLASRIETEVTPKLESSAKPRLDIEELKRSERRLQEMLDAPVPEITVHPPKNETNKSAEDESIAKVQEKLINIAVDPQQPIIIQSIDKLKDNTDDSGDEFGEVKITTPRKSVVTFNENVEKIIHLEYGIEDTTENPAPETEIYRF